MNRSGFIRRRAKMLMRAGGQRAKCAALAPLTFGERLVAMDYAFHGAKGPIAPSLARVLEDLDDSRYVPPAAP